MFCIRCGKENAGDAAFCQKCGHAFETEEETRVAARAGASVPPDTIDSARIFSITPTLKFVYVGYLVAVIAAFGLVVIVSLFLASMISLAVSVILGMALLLVPFYYHLRKKLV